MISRRIGPISPARSRPGSSDDADDTIAASVDRFGLGNSPRTFGIGITPNASVELSVPHSAPTRKVQSNGTATAPEQDLGSHRVRQ
jgi:hypothetical protein